ncbi:MAG: GntR family transcriptional regulator [Chloroflexi bacterium]|nr:GntR family transcriptional regulator [Chloroflexota bacterium]
MSFQFPAVPARVLRQDVLAVLRKAILEGDLKPGDRLLEADVAAQMGISRAPVREAVRQLEQEGLVDFQPHRGSTVLGVPNEEIDAIYELRAELESRAIRRACERITDEQIEELAEHLHRMGRAVEAGDYSAVFEADHAFHATIQRVAGYRLLRRMWESMDGLVRVRSYQAFEGEGPANKYFRRTAVSSHVPILAALRARDADAAEKAVRDHILEVSERIQAEDSAAAAHEVHAAAR